MRVAGPAHKYRLCTGAYHRVVPSYGQFCPVAMASEILNERWTPLVLRELLCGSTRFNELRRGLPRMSPSLLSSRLKRLERTGILERHERAEGGPEYRLTTAGEELRPIVEALGAWGQRWAQADMRPEHLDATLLLWDMHRRLCSDRLPDRRVVVELHVRGSADGRTHYWLVLDGGRADLCLFDPGHDVDLVVEAPVDALVAWWSGTADLRRLVRGGTVAVTGPRALARAFPDWFRRGAFAALTPGPRRSRPPSG